MKTSQKDGDIDVLRVIQIKNTSTNLCMSEKHLNEAVAARNPSMKLYEQIRGSLMSGTTVEKRERHKKTT